MTREDRREAKALRKLEPAPGAAPLPSPRFLSETDSSISESIASTARRRAPFDTQSSTASSDLNFLIRTAAPGTFGTRSTFGRAVEPRIPATVGEGRLHNSLAKYFGQNYSYKEGESAGGSRASSASYDSKERYKGTAAAPAAAAAAAVEGSSPALGKAETRETSLADSPANYCDEESKREYNLDNESGIAEGEESSLSVLVGTSGDVAAPAKNARPAKTAKPAKRLGPATDRNIEEGGYGLEADEGRLAKAGGVAEDCIEPGRRRPKCKCLNVWPWKVRWVCLFTRLLCSGLKWCRCVCVLCVYLRFDLERSWMHILTIEMQQYLLLIHLASLPYVSSIIFTVWLS